METQQQSNPTPAGNPSGKNFLKQMEEFFDTYLHKKAPFHLPPNAKEWIVKFGPWITLVLMVIAIPVILLALGLSSAVTPYMMAYGAHYYNPLFMLSGIIALASLVMEAMALPGLFSRSLKGWHLLYYAVLVGAVGQLLSGQIISLIINVVISMYFLFEVRELYK